MVLVEHVLRLGDVPVVGGRRLPRHAGQVVQVGAGHGILGRSRVHPLQPLQLLIGYLLDFLRHPGLFDLLVQLVHLADAGIVLTQLFLDLPHLFPEQVLLLGLPHPFGHLRLDLALHLEALHLAGEVHVDLLEALQGVDHLQEGLEVFERQVDVEGDQVRQAGRVVDVVDHLHDIVGERFPVGEGDLQEGVEARYERLGNHGLFHELPHRLDPGQDDRGFLYDGLQPDPCNTFEDGLGASVGELLELVHLADGPYLVQRGEHVAGWLSPELDEGHHVAEHHAFLEGGHFGAVQVEGKDHVGKCDHIPERVEGNYFGYVNRDLGHPVFPLRQGGEMACFPSRVTS